MSDSTFDINQPPVAVRKIVTVHEEIHYDGFGTAVDRPQHKAAIVAIIKNPYAGRYEENVQPFMEALKPLGLSMAKRLIEVLGGKDRVESYGKGAIVGMFGELEIGAAWHVPGGYAMREALGGAKAIVPSTTKVGAPAAAIDIPLHHIDAAYVRSHFDTMEVRVGDAPRPFEIMYVLAMSSGARVHARMGGLKASEISVWDGQR